MADCRVLLVPVLFLSDSMQLSRCCILPCGGSGTVGRDAPALPVVRRWHKKLAGCSALSLAHKPNHRIKEREVSLMKRGRCAAALWPLGSHCGFSLRMGEWTKYTTDGQGLLHSLYGYKFILHSFESFVQLCHCLGLSDPPASRTLKVLGFLTGAFCVAAEKRRSV